MLPVSFQLLSDLHLEHHSPPHPHGYDIFTPPQTAPYLLLTGDIGALSQSHLYHSFLSRLSKNYTKLFLVPGNHEFYRLPSHSHGLQLLSDFESSLAPLTVLHRRRVDIPDSDVSLLGCTLHSHIKPEQKAAVTRRLADFRMTGDWGPEEYASAHDEDVRWLQEQVKAVAGEGRRAVVATHHAPTEAGVNDPALDGSGIGSAFATELRWWEWQGGRCVKVWVFGHTHWCCDFEIEGTRVVANQRGYAGEKTGFREGFVVEA